MTNKYFENYTIRLYRLNAAIIIFALIISYSILKKLFKMLIFSLLILILYLGYLMYTGQDLPDENKIKNFLEPIAQINIITPSDYLGPIIELCVKKRGSQTNLQYRTNSVEISFEIPLSEIIYDFFDKLKSCTKGYASYDYTIIDYVESKMIKLDILVNKKKVDALSQILHKDNSDKKAREAYEILGSDGVKTLKERYNKGG